MTKIGIILSRGVFRHLTTQLEGESACENNLFYQNGQVRMFCILAFDSRECNWYELPKCNGYILYIWNTDLSSGNAILRYNYKATVEFLDNFFSVSSFEEQDPIIWNDWYAISSCFLR